MRGLLLIDKPKEFTSFDVVAVLRGITKQRRIGHTGTLDPMATGVLPVLVGNATRLADILPSNDKAYRAEFRFGIKTDTLDIWGNVLRREQTCHTLAEIEAALPLFTGDIMQMPPMYSAVKQNGKRLYEIARKGGEVARPARPATVYSIKIIGFDEPEQTLTLDIHCAGGTYIRSLCDDLGEKLGSCAAMSSLRRTMACGFSLTQCVCLAQLKEDGAEKHLLEPQAALRGYNEVRVSEKQAARFLCGGALDISRLTLPAVPATSKAADEYLLVYHKYRFLGVGKLDETAKQLKVRCLFD
ncbi:MAG TPA: tRNA pseudouridine(55) synthase TruB [Ruminococcaceae bacterium]|nr:tRNA pseudouridine(55) synthase TruB [Oscillospiraceae bacterium]